MPSVFGSYYQGHGEGDGKIDAGQANIALEALAASGRAQVVERYGARFWSAFPAHFPNTRNSRRATPDSTARAK